MRHEEGEHGAGDQSCIGLFHRLRHPRAPACISREPRVHLLQLRKIRRKLPARPSPAGGILHFHAIDIWPSVTMAAIDFYRVPTKVYSTVQRSFAPVAASLEYDRDRWKPGETVRVGVWAINDRWEDVPGATIEWHIEDPAGRMARAGRIDAPMPAHSAQKVGEVDWIAGEPGSYALRAQVRGTNREPVS